MSSLIKLNENKFSFVVFADELSSRILNLAKKYRRDNSQLETGNLPE